MKCPEMLFTELVFVDVKMKSQTLKSILSYFSQQEPPLTKHLLCARHCAGSLYVYVNIIIFIYLCVSVLSRV